MKHTHIHTLRHTPPFSQSSYTNSKPKITWNNAFSVKPKRKNPQGIRGVFQSTHIHLLPAFWACGQYRCQKVTLLLQIQVSTPLLFTAPLPSTPPPPTPNTHRKRADTSLSITLVLWAACSPLSDLITRIGWQRRAKQKQNKNHAKTKTKNKKLNTDAKRLKQTDRHIEPTCCFRSKEVPEQERIRLFFDVFPGLYRSREHRPDPLFVTSKNGTIVVLCDDDPGPPQRNRDPGPPQRNNDPGPSQKNSLWTIPKEQRHWNIPKEQWPWTTPKEQSWCGEVTKVTEIESEASV